MFSLHADWALLDDGFVPDTRVDIDGGAIVAVRPAGAAPPAAPPAERLHGLLLPAMANLHSHAFQRVFAGLAEHRGGGTDFWTWREAMYAASSRLTPALYAPVMAWVGKELLKGGYASVAEFHYVHHRPDGAPYAPATAMAGAVAEGAAEAGIALTLLVGVYETGGFDGAPLRGPQCRFRNDAAAALAMQAALRTDPGVRVGYALHSLRAVPPATLRALVQGAAPGAPIHIHVAEQRAEIAACIATLGAPPVAWLLDNAPLDARWCLVHATHATEAELKAAARTGATVGLCPTTEADLGDGVFALPAWLDAGGAFGIGSDSNVALDAAAELRLLEYGQRLRDERRAIAAADGGHCGRTLWQRAARGGAAACGRACGRIAPGFAADLVVVEPPVEAAWAAPDAALDAALFAATRTPVRDVMAGGTWQVRDRRHRNETALDAAYRAALGKLAA